MKQTEALTKALVLAIVAPSDEQMHKALDLVYQISQGLSIDDIKQCQSQAAYITGVKQ